MWEAYNLHDLLHDMFAGLELYDTDPAQHLITAGNDLGFLDRDQSDLSHVWKYCIVMKRALRVSQFVAHVTQ